MLKFYCSTDPSATAVEPLVSGFDSLAPGSDSVVSCRRDFCRPLVFPPKKYQVVFSNLGIRQQLWSSPADWFCPDSSDLKCEICWNHSEGMSLRIPPPWISRRFLGDTDCCTMSKWRVSTNCSIIMSCSTLDLSARNIKAAHSSTQYLGDGFFCRIGYYWPDNLPKTPSDRQSWRLTNLRSQNPKRSQNQKTRTSTETWRAASTLEVQTLQITSCLNFPMSPSVTPWTVRVFLLRSDCEYQHHQGLCGSHWSCTPTLRAYCGSFKTLFKRLQISKVGYIANQNLDVPILYLARRVSCGMVDNMYHAFKPFWWTKENVLVCLPRAVSPEVHQPPTSTWGVAFGLSSWRCNCRRKLHFSRTDSGGSFAACAVAYLCGSKHFSNQWSEPAPSF